METSIVIKSPGSKAHQTRTMNHDQDTEMNEECNQKDGNCQGFRVEMQFWKDIFEIFPE